MLGGGEDPGVLQLKLSTFALKSDRRRTRVARQHHAGAVARFLIRRDDARWAKLIKERDIAVEGAK